MTWQEEKLRAHGSLEHSLPNLLRRTHLAFLKVLERVLADYRIPIESWKFLRSVWDEDGLDTRQLSERIGVPMAEVQRGLEPLKALGPVSVTREGGDNSERHQVLLTAAGIALQAQLQTVPADIMKLSQARLSQEEQTQLWRLLNTVHDTLQSEVSGDMPPPVPPAS